MIGSKPETSGISSTKPLRPWPDKAAFSVTTGSKPEAEA